MGKFIDGEYVSNSAASKHRRTNASGLEIPMPTYAEPTEQKFGKRIFNWLKEKRTRVIPSGTVEIIPEQHVVPNSNEAIVWEKETVKQGPAYKVIQTTRLVKLSELEDIVESEQNIEQELTELEVDVTPDDWHQISETFQPAPPPKAPAPIVKKIIPRAEAEMMYVPPRPKVNVIKANPFLASTSNLIPLNMPMHFSHPTSQGQTMVSDAPAYDADEAMRQEYLRNRNRPGYIAPVVYNLEGYENAIIHDNNLQDMAEVEIPEVANPNIMSMDDALSQVDGRPKGRKAEVNLMDEMEKAFGDVL